MMLPPVDLRRARELIDRFDGAPVLVAGDVMLDRFIVGRVSRISPEAPVPVVRFESEHDRLGGAANVAHNITTLGGKVSLVALVGADDAAKRLKKQLWAVGISADGLIEDRDRPTTEKVRIVTDRNQQVARVDYERDVDVSGAVERAAVDRAARMAKGMKALLISDYLKGTITRSMVEGLLAARGAGAGAVPLIVDPKVPHLACYRGATLITPNHQEAEAATQRRIRTDDEAREAAHDFRERAGCDAVLITRGEQGMWLSDATGDGAVRAMAREVSDVTGAGDTVAATLALTLAAGGTLAEAAVLANHAAGVVVGKFGPATLTREELLATFSATS